jgi:hypothetical protein
MFKASPRIRISKGEVRGVTVKIKSACQLTDDELEHLRSTLDALAHPQPGSA